MSNGLDQGILMILQGGHFAALEQPESYLEDVEGFLEVAFKK